MSTPSPFSSLRSGRSWSDPERVRRVMLAVGAVLLPLGLLAIILGWYGTANTPYQYDQISYLVSGGLLGLGLILFGGFLLFGAWLAQIATVLRDLTTQLGDATSTVPTRRLGEEGRTEVVSLVTAGAGATVHRRDCGLIASRTDLVPVSGSAEGMAACRVCAPLGAPA